MTTDEQFKALTRPRGRPPKIIRFKNGPLKRAPEFNKILISTKYYYRIDAKLPSDPDWDAFTGTVVTKKPRSPEFFDRHVREYFEKLPYLFRLVMSKVDRYRFTCMFDDTCAHKEKNCVARYISSQPRRYASASYEALPLEPVEEGVESNDKVSGND